MHIKSLRFANDASQAAMRASAINSFHHFLSNILAAESSEQKQGKMQFVDLPLENGNYFGNNLNNCTELIIRLENLSK